MCNVNDTFIHIMALCTPSIVQQNGGHTSTRHQFNGKCNKQSSVSTSTLLIVATSRNNAWKVFASPLRC